MSTQTYWQLETQCFLCGSTENLVRVEAGQKVETFFNMYRKDNFSTKDVVYTTCEGCRDREAKGIYKIRIDRDAIAEQMRNIIPP